MMLQLGPCGNVSQVAQIIAAVGAIVTPCMLAFLAQRRVRADRDARRHRRNEEQVTYNMAQTLDDVQRKVNRIDKNGS